VGFEHVCRCMQKCVFLCVGVFAGGCAGVCMFAYACVCVSAPSSHCMTRYRAYRLTKSNTSACGLDV